MSHKLSMGFASRTSAKPPRARVQTAPGRSEEKPRLLVCHGCGTKYPAKKRPSDYHDDACRRRAAREREGEEYQKRRFLAFCRFHAEHPQVYMLFRSFAEAALNSRRPGSKFGARMIWERLRWYTDFETNVDRDYKLNNNHTPYYSRLLMLRDERFREFFERRDTRFDVDDEELLEGVRQAEASR